MLAVFYCLLAVSLCVTPGQSVWWKRDHRPCDLPGHAWIPYTGFRIQRQYMFGLFSGGSSKWRHSSILTHCARGRVDYEVWLSTDSITDIQWGRDYCPDDTAICYRIVRRKQFALRDMSIYLPYTFIGGVFSCPGRSSGTVCTNENARPILPLYADDLSHQWFQLQVPDNLLQTKIIQRVPYLYTPTWTHPLGLWQYPQPENLAWSVHLDINEDYDFTLDERGKFNKALTQMINLINEYFPKPLNHNTATDLTPSTESISLKLLEQIGRFNPTNALSFLQKIQAPFDQLQFSEKVFR